MKRFISIAVCAALLAFGGSQIVRAEAGPLSIGGRAVNFEPIDGNGSWQGGAKARLNLPLSFAVEASVDHDWPVQATALFFILPKVVWVQPYLLGGVGWYGTKVEGPNGFNDTQNRTGGHAGAGVDFNFNDHWYADATYRYIWLKDVHTVDANGSALQVRDRGHMITIGLNYRL
jgi:hypothetical protein